MEPIAEGLGVGHFRELLREDSGSYYTVTIEVNAGGAEQLFLRLDVAEE
jgi:hypothetical protein